MTIAALTTQSNAGCQVRGWLFSWGYSRVMTRPMGRVKLFSNPCGLGRAKNVGNLTGRVRSDQIRRFPISRVGSGRATLALI